MTYFQNNFIGYIFLLLAMSFLNSCSKPDRYTIGAISVSEKGYGVLLTKVIAHSESQIPFYEEVDTIRIHPIIPFEYSNITSLKKLSGIPKNKLPNYITFQYQYAEISDCKIARKAKTFEIQFLTDFDYLRRRKGDIVVMNMSEA